MVGGELGLYVERGGRSLLTWATGEELGLAVDGLAQAARSGRLGRVTVERVNGEPVFDSPVAQALSKAGFRITPRGYRLGPSGRRASG
jgi:ATP-dependent Lhr-like helicase